MKKIIFVLLILTMAASWLALPTPTLAQEAGNTIHISSYTKLLDVLSFVGRAGGYQTEQNIASTPIIVGIVIRAFLNFLGITFIILMIIAGYSWMTAGGNEEQVKKAISTIKQSVIGLIIAISAYTIWIFVFERIILMK